MSIRVILCTFYVLFFTVYAVKSWRASLAAVIILMAFFQHPDMPKSIAGVQGLNLWNLLMGATAIAWLMGRKREGLPWDMPKWFQRMLALYLVVVVISVMRLLVDPPPQWRGLTMAWFISEYLINCFKWILPGIVLYDSCRTRSHVMAGLFAVLGLYLLLALQVIRHMPPSYALADNFAHLAYKMVQESVGYNRVTLSMMLGGAVWATVAFRPIARTRGRQIIVLLCAAIIFYGQALTGGRSGYVGWATVGLILCVVRWRKMLPFIPLTLIAVCIALPGVRERIFQGIGTDGESNDLYAMSSGRNIAWPYVIAKIKEGPVFGFGREAMNTTGIYNQILYDTEGDEVFPHPHNAYLEILLDCGIVGFLVVVPFYLMVLKCAFSLFRDKGDPLYTATGGVACALVLALMVAAMGGETFYPREGSLGMWAGIGIMMRVWVERKREQQAALEAGINMDEVPAEDPMESAHAPA